jgi:SAM-dependent methyltransferase
VAGRAKWSASTSPAQCWRRCHRLCRARFASRPGTFDSLDFEDDTFELVVCFEVIELVADPLIVLDELVRVLAPGGLLLLSSPDRDVYPPGNPHHLHEFDAAELGGGAVRKGFSAYAYCDSGTT